MEECRRWRCRLVSILKEEDTLHVATAACLPSWWIWVCVLVEVEYLWKGWVRNCPSQAAAQLTLQHLALTLVEGYHLSSPLLFEKKNGVQAFGRSLVLRIFDNIWTLTKKCSLNYPLFQSNLPHWLPKSLFKEISAAICWVFNTPHSRVANLKSLHFTV